MNDRKVSRKGNVGQGGEQGICWDQLRPWQGHLSSALRRRGPQPCPEPYCVTCRAPSTCRTVCGLTIEPWHAPHAEQSTGRPKEAPSRQRKRLAIHWMPTWKLGISPQWDHSGSTYQRLLGREISSFWYYIAPDISLFLLYRYLGGASAQRGSWKAVPTGQHGPAEQSLPPGVPRCPVCSGVSRKMLNIGQA